MLTRWIITLLILFNFVLPIQPITAPYSEHTYAEQSLAPATQQKEQDLFQMEYFPVAPFRVGDVISVRISYSGDLDLNGQAITLTTSNQPNSTLAQSVFNVNQQAFFFWILDTKDLEPGFIKMTYQIKDADIILQDGFNLLPAPEEETAIWESVESNCCQIYFLSGSDAAEDISFLKTILEQETAQVMAQFYPEGQTEVNPFSEEKLSLVLIPIVIGHGGFATDEAVLTYSHRNWSGTEFENLAHHEIVHVVDRYLNAEGPRPSLLAEGLAVYLSGGHYREGPLLEQAAALIKMDLYIPLGDMVNDFYAAQHEISYIEAGALVAYLVNTWGWDSFINFYFTLQQNNSDRDIISAGVVEAFGMSFDQLETHFINHLKTLTPSPGVAKSVQLTINAYETLRRYETVAIPSAHFRTAWWPDVRTMREKNLVGDYANREKAPFNLIMEQSLIQVHIAIAAGKYEAAEEKLDVMNHFLALVEDQNTPISHYAIGWPLPDKIPLPKISPFKFLP